MRHIKPFFAERSRYDLWLMRLSVALNLAVICFAAVYLVAEHDASGVGWPHVLAAVILGYFIADFASGLVHWGMDTWFSERELGRAASIAREHHTHPQHILGYGFLEFSTLGSAPSAAVIGPAAMLTSLLPSSAAAYMMMIVWLITAACLCFGTSFHNLAHRPANRIVGYAQRLHLIIPSKEHWAHHHEQQLVRYCVINGWANYVCDPLGVWRGLEWLIQSLTGIEPRRDDLEWQRRYREAGNAPNVANPGAAM